MIRPSRQWIYWLVLLGVLAAGLITAPGAAEAAGAWAGDWTTIGDSSNGFSWPRSIAIDNNDNVYVVDNGLKVIRKLADGSDKWSIVTGLNMSQKVPWDIAAGGDNNVYLLNSIWSNSQVVWKYDGSSWTDITHGYDFRSPDAIGADKDGNVYVSYSGEDGGHVIKLASGSTVWTEIGSWENGEFVNPCAITADEQGNLYVADYSIISEVYRGRIKILPKNSSQWQDAADGNFLPSEGFNWVQKPVEIVRDSFGNFYIADPERQIIHAAPTGSAGWWYINNGSVNTFSNPTGVAVDSKGYVYVSDPNNGKVYKHQPWATQLIWKTQPGGAAAGNTLNPQPVIALAGPDEDVVTGDSSSTISLSLTNASGATLSGQGSLTLSEGEASFSGLSVNNAGTYTLTSTGSIINTNISNYNNIDSVGPSTLTGQSSSFTITALLQAAAPTASPASGSTVANNSVINLSTTTAGATIYYTVDGTDPTIGSSSGTSVTITGDPGAEVTVKAMAGGTGFISSPVATFTYNLQPQAAAPTASPVSGSTVANNSVINLSTDTAGATIYYTVDGTDPTTGTGSSGNTVTITGNPDEEITLKAFAAATNMVNSEIVTFTYNLQPQAAAPTASPGSGSLVTNNSTVTLSTATAGATIYYTVDGTDPTTDSSPGTDITITGNTGENITIRALAAGTGMENSEIAIFTYTVALQAAAPTASPASGSTVANNSVINLSTTTAGATIYYTTNGTDPTTGSSNSGTSVTITGDPDEEITLKAFAAATNMVNSSIETFTYTLQPLADTPSAEPPSGSVVANNTTVTLITGMENATIYYTLDESDPDESSNSGTSAVITGSLEDTITLKAIAVAPNMEVSDMATFTYTIGLPTDAPEASISDGSTVANNTEVLLSTNTNDAVIYYTLDGRDPSQYSLSGSSATITGQPEAEVILKAIAIAPGMAVSDIAAFTYYLQPRAAVPTASPVSGSRVTDGATVNLSTATAGATIYYTIDGTDPTIGSTSGNSVKITGDHGNTVIVKAFAIAPDMADSNVAVFAYTIRKISSGGGGGDGGTSSAGLLVTPPGGTFNEQNITLVFPAGAVESNTRVQIREISQADGLPLPDNSLLLSKIVDLEVSDSFFKPVTITLPFDKPQIDPEKFDIKICCYYDNTGQWVPLENIQVHLTKGLVSGDVTHFTKFAVLAIPKTGTNVEPPSSSPSIPFDLTGHWAGDSVMQLMEAGIVSGYQDGSFKPDRTISRAEFTVMLVKALKLETVNGKVFADTAAHWAKNSIANAAAHNIISGYDENRFGPDDLITREQAALIVTRAVQAENNADGLNFTDSGQISSWAKLGVSAAVSNGFFNGYPDGSFRPQSNLTRAEAVVIIRKMLR